MPIVREADGLAMSSRNAYLTAEQRAAARAVPEALETAAAALAWGERDARALEAAMCDAVCATADGMAAVEYAAVVDPATLEPLERAEGEARALIAVRFGATRLIDNCLLVACDTECDTAGE